MKKYSKLIKILIIALLIEIFIFNITSFRLLFGNYETKEWKEFDVMWHDEDNSTTWIELKDINTKVGTIKVDYSDDIEGSGYFICYDDATSERYRDLTGKYYVQDSPRTKYMPLYLSGETDRLIVQIESYIYDTESLEAIVVNENIPVEFNIIRFAVILLIMIVGYLLKNWNLLNKEFSAKDYKQDLVLIVVLIVFFIILGWINRYSLIDGESDIYTVSFLKAVVNKQFYLPEEPSEAFMQLEDPYDEIVRSSMLERGEDFVWDTAYYNGKQYVYFGILPLLLTFLPYYLVTRQYLSIGTVVFGFSVLIFVLLKELLIKVLERYFEGVSFKTVLYSFIILASGSLIWYANGMSRTYELVIIVGLYFVLQGLYLIFTSMNEGVSKYKRLFLGSLCLALSVACRPTDVLATIIVVPYFLKLLIDSVKNFKNKKSDLFKLILVVGIPYITVAGLLMWYNYVRFGNIFEFGARYQLTINNMNEIGNRFSSIPVGLFINLFSVPNFINKFPFIAHHNNFVTYYGYYYIENMVGGVFILAPICFMNFMVLKAFKKTDNKELKVLISTLLITATISAGLSAMMAGSNQRYLIDYAWMYILSGILIFMIFYKNFKEEETKKLMQKILGVVAIATFLIGFASGIISEKNNMKEVSPREYYKAEYTTCFWE